MSRLPLTLVVLALTAGTALAAPGAAVLRISADASGAMRFDRASLRASPGRVTISMRNPSVLPHNVAIRGNGVKRLGKVVLKGGTSTVTASLKSGRYLFYCSVPGHEKAGMKGVLTVR